MERSFTDHDIHQLGSKFDIEIVEEASYLVWYIWRDTKPSYSRLQDCITALTTDEELYRALKFAHAEGDYRAIREWKSVSRHIIQNSLSPKFLQKKHPRVILVLKMLG